LLRLGVQVGLHVGHLLPQGDKLGVYLAHAFLFIDGVGGRCGALHLLLFKWDLARILQLLGLLALKLDRSWI